ncbi:MAG: hypothetical protein IAG10_20555 [Planctomycetaceae bacterium]|nr:hypothetical protein [Planctomycetaceae bacterium]
MTLNDLQALIHQGDKSAMMAALDGVEAGSRSKLAKAALKAAKELGTKIFEKESVPVGQSLEQFATPEQAMARWQHKVEQIFCCWLATYPLGA